MSSSFTTFTSRKVLTRREALPGRHGPSLRHEGAEAPNAVGLSVVRLVSIEGSTLVVEGVDMLDGTPLLDIKPFVPEFDAPQVDVRTGWLEGKADKAREARADKRFFKD